MRRLRHLPFYLILFSSTLLWAQEMSYPDSGRTVKMHIIALDQPVLANRLGASFPGGIIYALREDVVPFDYVGGDAYEYDVSTPLEAGNVRLRTGKRPRPIVIRANEGDLIEITFTNCLTEDKTQAGVALPSSLQTSERQVGFHIAGLEVRNIMSLSSFTGANPNSYAQPAPTLGVQHTPDTGAVPNQTLVYTYYAQAEGAYIAYSHAGESSQENVGLFGMCNVQPKEAEWYRSQVTHEELVYATLNVNTLGANRELTPRNNRRGIQEQSARGEYLWNLVTRNGALGNTAKVVVRDDRVYTLTGHPIIDYQAVYPANHPRTGQPVLNMLDQNDNLIYSDLTAIITGPNAGAFSTSDNSPVFAEVPASPNRRQPYREISTMYHQVQNPMVQSFVQQVDPATTNAFSAGNDEFCINYGVAGIGPEILANRLGVGPMGNPEAVDLKYEEFFLSSWTVGDPAMIVDVPANAPNSVVSNPTDGQKVKPNVEAVNDELIYEDMDFRKATKAFYPDDPSNVYHSYMRDHVKFRVANVTGPPHVHHQHAHQWLHSPNSPDGHYLDSQLITNGSTYTLEMVYNGSGNRNQTVGDSIFHCHFYPHFAKGMWGLWRVHDVFESGTILNPDGTVNWDVDNRALPDGEITSGTPIPAIVPMPTLAMAPIPAKVTLTHDGRRSVTHPTLVGEFLLAENPGYPFFIPGLAGSRAPHPPMDFAWVETEEGTPKMHKEGRKKGTPVLLDGGLPRHIVFGGDIVREFHTRWDFTKDFILYDDEDKTNKNRQAIAGGMLAYELPEEGTATERAAMRAHATRTHASSLPNGQPGNFILNGLPPVPGAPYADPGIDDDGNATGEVLRYQGANIQLDVVFNKSGWHYPQQRIITLWMDVASTISGKRPPEPLFFRANTGNIVEYWHTNLVPNYYELDDFQVRTPTDILGQHIHLVKFDVTSSDGAANGFNYEDGTFSTDEVRERIDAANLVGGLYAYNPITQGPNFEVQHTLTVQPYELFYPFFGEEPDDQNWDGAQTTVQRWYADDLLNNLGEDRTLRTVFTHDHFGPSTHQQAGLYAGLVVEPQDSYWFTNEVSWGGDETGATVEYPANTQMPARSDGGPTTWQAVIQTADPADSYREFLLEFQDTAIAYNADSRTTTAIPDTPLFTIPTCSNRGASCPVASGTGPLTYVWSPCTDEVDALIQEMQANGDVIPDLLREQFARSGITLSEFATMRTIVELEIPPDTSWVITDPLVPDDEDIDEAEVYAITLNSALTCTDSNNDSVETQGLEIRVETMHPGWADNTVSGTTVTTTAINRNSDSNHPLAPPWPQLISTGGQGTQTVNYRAEPVPSRVDTSITDPDPNADANAGDLAYAYSSITRTDPRLNVQPDQNVGGEPSNPISAGSTFYYPARSINPTGTGPGDVQPTDPYTPVLQAYEGDNVQVRTLVGAHLNPQAYMAHGVKWFFEPSHTNSGYRNVQHMGISEHFEMLFQLPESDNTHYSGAPVDTAFSDYLWLADSSFKGVTAGVWGLMRAYDDSETLDLPRLPNNPQGSTTGFDWDGVADTFAGDSSTWPDNYRSFKIRATNKTDDGSAMVVTYNDRGKTETNFPFTTEADTPIEQTDGLAYFLEQEITKLGQVDYEMVGGPDGPMILRAAAGDFIEIILETDIDNTTALFTSSVAASAPFGKDGAPSVDMNVSDSAGLSAQLVSYDVDTSDGTNVGFNQFQTTNGNEIRYYWYAGNLVPENGTITPEPVEFGAIVLNPPDLLLQVVPGLIGAMVIEPEGSTWTVDADAPYSACVTKSDGSTFRDFVAIFQELPLTSNQSLASEGLVAAYNYKAEPQSYRVAEVDGADTYSNTIVGDQEPQIPIYRVAANTEFRIRHLFPGGDCPNTFALEGHGWQEEPYTNNSTEIGHNPESQFFGTQQFYANDQFNMTFYSAGGVAGVTGDYQMYPFNQDSLGGWAMVRVEPATVVVNKAHMNQDGRLVIAGHVLSAETVSESLVIDILAEEEISFEVPIDRETGAWSMELNQADCRPGDKLILTTRDGARHVTAVQGRASESAPKPIIERDPVDRGR